MFSEEKAFANLCTIYDEYLKRHKLPELSADELLCELEESKDNGNHALDEHIEWVKAHNGEPGNELVDTIAQSWRLKRYPY